MYNIHKRKIHFCKCIQNLNEKVYLKIITMIMRNTKNNFVHLKSFIKGKTQVGKNKQILGDFQECSLDEIELKIKFQRFLLFFTL